jgi:hypothetical protein
LALFFTSQYTHGFGCLDEPYHLPPTLESIHGSSPFDFTDFSSFPQNLGFLVHPKSEGKSLHLGKTLFWEFVPFVEMTLVSKFHLIWCPITQESRLGRNGRILRENHVF